MTARLSRLGRRTDSRPVLPARGWLAVLAAALALPAVHAGRPLATDDAAIAEPGSCQLEAWQDRARGARDTVLAPACGLPGGLELGAEGTWPRPVEGLRATAGASLKWVPEAWRLDTPLGEAGFGLKFAAGLERPAGAGTGRAWRHADSTLLALASLRPAPTLAWHLNVGVGRARAVAPVQHTSTWLAGVAAAWTPGADWLVFAEAQSSGRREAFGGLRLAGGARCWLIPERLGLDLTLARERGSPRAVGVGLGWYGIGL
ncbi:MAG: hypothetical protein RI988_3867 [Pseudomonadota bacterium]|jgi:hypothetical protein